MSRNQNISTTTGSKGESTLGPFDVDADERRYADGVIDVESDVETGYESAFNDLPELGSRVSRKVVRIDCSRLIVKL